MQLKRPIKENIKDLINPERGMRRRLKRSFEQNLNTYLTSLVIVAVMAGLFTFLFRLGRSLVLSLMRDIDVHYWRMINYTTGHAVSMLFLYLFVGTVVLFIITYLTWSFTKDLKYVKVIDVFFFAMTPLLLFGWIPFLAPSLMVWAAFLVFVGLRVQKGHRVAKGSLEERD